MPESQISPSALQMYDHVFAEFYDYHAHRGGDDIAFYVDLAQAAGGRVLELGCGTGRVLLPVARAGVPITGVDRSPAMLAVCERKLSQETQPLRKSVALVQDDLCQFHLGASFSLVIVPFGPFQALLEVEQQLACLRLIHEHLEPGGRLVIDIQNPSLYPLLTDGDDGPTGGSFDTAEGQSGEWSLQNASVDVWKQIVYEELVYEVRGAGGETERLVYPDVIRFYYRHELEHLLARTGFALTGLYGDFQYTEYDSESLDTGYPGDMIAVAARS